MSITKVLLEDDFDEITEERARYAIRRIRLAITLFNGEEDDTVDEAVFILLRYGNVDIALLELIAGYVYEYSDRFKYDELFNEDGSLIDSIIRCEDYPAIRG